MTSESEATSNTEQITQSEHERHLASSPLEDLTLVKLTDLRQVPERLLGDLTNEEIADEDSVNRCYEFGAQIAQDPSNICLGLKDGDDDTVGFIWLITDPIQQSLFCRFLAIDEDYRGGHFVEYTTAVMQELARELGIKHLLGCTVRMSDKWRNLGWNTLDTQLIHQEV